MAPPGGVEEHDFRPVLVRWNTSRAWQWRETLGVGAQRHFDHMQRAFQAGKCIAILLSW